MAVCEHFHDTDPLTCAGALATPWSACPAESLLVTAPVAAVPAVPAQREHQDADSPVRT